MLSKGSFINAASCGGCISGYTCTNNKQYPGGAYYPSEGCIYSSYYACGGCPDGKCIVGIQYARTLEDCDNRENLITTSCCIEETCTPSSGCSCGSLANSNQGYGSKSVSCSDGCGGSTSSTCYCYACTPLACPSNTYSTNQGNGSITTNCPSPNACGVNNTRTCYCPAADCADLDDEVTWSNTKPSGDYRIYTGSVPIPNNPSGCPASQNKTCYIAYSTNRPPTNTTVEIIPKEQLSASNLFPNNPLIKFIKKIRAADFTDEILGFTSNSHSGRGRDVDNGGGVNNPVGLRAVYEDVNGQDDILAIYIWWNPYEVKTFPTPNKLGIATPRTNSNQNFGFLISRDSIGGTWNKVYVPRTYGGDTLWIEKGSVNDDSVIIPGSTTVPNDMVELSNFNVSNSGTNGIELKVQMKFLNDSGNDIVTTNQYNLWAMANDYVGFTKFETDGNIKDSGNEFWDDSGTDWNLDMQTPNTCNISSISDTAVGEVTISVNAEDDDNISYVRLDACKSGIGTIDNLSTTYNNSYTLVDCDSFNSTGINITSGNSLLGINAHLYTDDPNNKQDSYEKEVEVQLNGNKEGSITFYLTVMDDAGNFDQDFEIYRLEQWAMVKNGFVFGKGGVTSSSRLVQSGSWSGHALLTSLDPFNEENADITNQVLMGGTSSLTTRLRALERYQVNKSFKVAKYPGILMTTPYSELMSAYRQKAANSTSFEHKTLGNNLSGSLSDQCSEDYCILERDDDLTINADFTCDKKGLIIAKGDITIIPDLTSGDSVDEACIILSGGNITIKAKRAPVGAGDPPEYDEIHAYLIANGEIVIEKHSTATNSSDNQAELYVKGGLSAFTVDASRSAAVHNEREMHFGHMGIYPVLVVENNAKYGFLSKGVFGSQIDIFKLEIGFKPF